MYTLIISQKVLVLENVKNGYNSKPFKSTNNFIINDLLNQIKSSLDYVQDLCLDAQAKMPDTPSVELLLKSLNGQIRMFRDEFSDIIIPKYCKEIQNPYVQGKLFDD